MLILKPRKKLALAPRKKLILSSKWFFNIFSLSKKSFDSKLSSNKYQLLSLVQYIMEILLSLERIGELMSTHPDFEHFKAERKERTVH